jgi:hypothetical protein
LTADSLRRFDDAFAATDYCMILPLFSLISSSFSLIRFHFIISLPLFFFFLATRRDARCFRVALPPPLRDAGAADYRFRH